MDDLLKFCGLAEKIIIEIAPIQKGTFSDKEGKKKVIIEAKFNENGDFLSKTYSDKIENYIYHEEEMICIHIANLDKTPICKIDHYYEDGKLIKKTRINEHSIVDEEETFYYNTDGKLSKKQSKTMTYEYIYENDKLLEERWHSDLSLNQIIRYSYENDELILIAHFSGDEIPGRKIVYKRERLGFISEEIIYSASGIIVSHFKYEYSTIYKNNWLKRAKYSLNTQNKRKDAIEVQYRDFKFYEIKEVKPEVIEPNELPKEASEEDNPSQKLEFDNGIYKGDVVEGEMHGVGDFIFNTGTRYQGLFKNNVMEGKGKLTYINGKVYEGTFTNNVLEGPGACKWANGDFYVGEFKNGKMDGRGCYIWENGNRFEGIFEDNRRTEQGILYKKSELESDAPPEWVNELFK